MPDSDDDHRWTSGDLPLPGHWPHARRGEDGEDRKGGGGPSVEPSGDAEPGLSLPEARAATRERARDVETLLANAARRHWPSDDGDAPPAPEPPGRSGMHARLMPVLRAVPWALATLFAFSFVWDFPTGAFEAFGQRWPLAGLLRTLSVSGLIGFLTNWLAVTMLFQPRTERPVFGQGLIPAQKERVAWRLAEAVSEDLINETVIKEKIRESGLVERYRRKAMTTMRAILHDEDFRRDLKRLTDEYARDVLSAPAVQRRVARFLIDRLEAHAREGGLGGLALRAYRTFGEEDFRRRIDAVVGRLPTSVEPALVELDTLLDRLPAHLEKRSDRIEEGVTRLVLRFVENLDVRALVRERIAAYDERQLERLFKKTSNEQLNYIKYLGAVLGIGGGLVIWAPGPSLTLFTSVGLLLWGLDAALMRRRA